MANTRSRCPPRIGITLGDINGVGPEVALKAAYRVARKCPCRIVLIGSSSAVRQQARAANLPVPPAWSPSNGAAPSSKVVLWDPTPGQHPAWKPGAIRADASRAAAAWIREAVRACVEGSLDAMVTAPICKEGFHAAGVKFPGHTEMLAELTHTRRFAMMLFGGPLRVVLVTRHIPLAKVATSLTQAKIVEAIRLAGEALPWMGWRQSRIAVCGLNPHAGDGGKIGREELTVIAPAIRRAQREGLEVTGPVPSDTVFHQAIKGRYDVVVAMYHDQGLGPLKMLAFDVGVNVTLGLPIVRTSPDHGTAFDIAGRNRANPQSMIEAVEWAVFLARRKNPWK